MDRTTRTPRVGVDVLLTVRHKTEDANNISNMNYIAVK